MRILLSPLLAEIYCRAPPPNTLLEHVFSSIQHQRSDSLSLKSRSAAIKELLRKPFNRSKTSDSQASTPPTPTRANTEERATEPDQHSLLEMTPGGQAEVPQAVNGVQELVSVVII